MSEIQATAPKAARDHLRYSNVWEDLSVLRAGLEIQRGARVLSIAAAGDNAIGLLLDDPDEVVAVDMSQTQLSLVELKLVALQRLSSDALHAFLGLSPARPQARIATYRGRLAPALSEAARRTFDAHIDDVAAGIVHAGALERWFRVFGRYLLPVVQRRSTIDALLAAQSIEAQREIFQTRFNHRLWRGVVRTFFSRALMGRGRDPAFMRFVDSDDVGTTMLRRSERALTTLSMADTLFMRWLMQGGPSMRALPTWARPEHRDVLCARASRLRLVRGDVRQVAAQEGHGPGARPFDAMNLSDIFEYMSPADASATWATLASSSTPAARHVWWQLLVERRPGPQDAVVEVSGTGAGTRGEDLWATDGGFFYGGLVVAQPRLDPVATGCTASVEPRA